MRGASPSIDWEKIRPQIDNAICELDDRDREAVILRYFQGLEIAAIGFIAAVAGTGLGAVLLFVSSIKLPMVLAAILVAVAGAALYSARSGRPEAKRGNSPSAAARQASAASDSGMNRSSSSVTTTAGTTTAPEGEVDPALAAGDAFLEKSPAVKAVLANSQRASMAASYFPLYVELGLDDAKATAFEEILCSTGMSNSYTGTIGPGTVKLRAFPKLSEQEREKHLPRWSARLASDVIKLSIPAAIGRR